MLYSEDEIRFYDPAIKERIRELAARIERARRANAAKMTLGDRVEISLLIGDVQRRALRDTLEAEFRSSDETVRRQVYDDLLRFWRLMERGTYQLIP